MPPAFPADPPPVGELVRITLANGAVIEAHFDGAQWWAGLNDNPADVPIDNDHVTAWEALT